MDPSRYQAARWSQRLPRTRGDEPSLATLVQTFSVAPPHTRGWTTSERRMIAIDGGLDVGFLSVALGRAREHNDKRKIIHPKG